MKFKIFGTIFVLVILILLYFVFAGAQAPTDENGAVTTTETQQ